MFPQYFTLFYHKAISLFLFTTLFIATLNPAYVALPSQKMHIVTTNSFSSIIEHSPFIIINFPLEVGRIQLKQKSFIVKFFSFLTIKMHFI